MNYEYAGGQGGGQPEMFWPEDDPSAQPDPFANQDLSGAQSNNKKPKKNDKSAKERKAIVPSYEGYVFTVLDPIRSGETASWVRTRKAEMPFSSQELYDKAMAHQRKTGLGLSGQFQTLGPNQQLLVNRLVAEKNAAEKEPNAEWKLFGVRKLFEERRSALRTLRVNNSLRVTLRRGDKAKDTVNEGTNRRFSNEEIDAANIVDLRDPVVKKDAAPKKKKKTEAEKEAEQQFNNPQINDPFRNMQNNDFVHNVEPYQPYPETHPQQVPHGDPFANMHHMSGALPAEGAIPAPPLQPEYRPEYRPEAPMPPQPQHFAHDNPFQPDPHVFPQPMPQAFDPFEERQPHDPVAYGHQHMSARRSSHSRRPSLPRRRESVDSDKIRANEARKLADVVRDEVRGAVRDEVRDEVRGVVRDEVRDEFRGAMRDAVAEDKVLHRWQTHSSGSGGSSRSAGQYDDFWSNPGSSGDRRHSHSFSTPATSPDRGERERYTPERPRFRRRDSSGARPYVDDRKRYYGDRNRDYVIRPHESYRENARDIRYPRDHRRQGHDDYPTARPRLRSREHQYERPPIQRRVTDYQEALRDADFSRRPGRSVDYERTRMNDRDDRRAHVYEEHRGGRDRQSLGRYL